MLARAVRWTANLQQQQQSSLRRQQRPSGLDCKTARHTLCSANTNRTPYLRYREGWTPLLFKDVQTDAALAIDVGVVDLRLKLNLGGLEGIVRRKVDHDKEDSARVRAVAGPHDSSLPSQQTTLQARSTVAIVAGRAKRGRRLRTCQ